MDYINPNMLYQTNEPEANKLSFDLEEFIDLSSGTWNNYPTSFEDHPTGALMEYHNEVIPHMWDNDGFEWMENTASLEMPLGDLMTVVQPSPSSAPSSQSNVFISFEEFEQFIYPSPNISWESSTSSALSDGSSPTSSTTDQQSPENHSAQPSPRNPPPDSDLTCSFCAKTFEKRHMLTRHRNQHIKPIPCPISGCSHRTAKTRDMQRHVVVHHAAEAPIAVPKFICPVVTCKHSEPGFKRRDHLLRHMKKLHTGILP